MVIKDVLVAYKVEVHRSYSLLEEVLLHWRYYSVDMLEWELEITWVKLMLKK